MKSLRFIHASDLHLDVLLPINKFLSSYDLNQAKETSSQAMLVREASFIALRHLIDLCLAEKVDFLVLAGDLYHQDDGSLKADFALHDSFEKLAKAGIAVFIAHGNHDPLLQSAPKLSGDVSGIALDTKPLAKKWADNVNVFSANVESLEFTRAGEKVAVVHGISHSKNAETQNLSKKFKRIEASLLFPDVFQMGVLHCTIGKADGHKEYAPCTIEDLNAAHLDYWALGHIHKRQELAKQPPIHYSGSMQGLHINETGQHGCLLIDVDERGRCTSKFCALAPVQWAILRFNIESLNDNSVITNETTLESEEWSLSPENNKENSKENTKLKNKKIDEDSNSLDELISNIIEQIHELAESEKSSVCQLMVFRVILEGRGTLDSVLSKASANQDLYERLCARLESSVRLKMQEGLQAVPVVIKDIQIKTKPMRDLNSLRKTEGFVGELLRYSSNLKNALNQDIATKDADNATALSAPTVADLESITSSLAGLYEVKRNKHLLPAPPSPELMQQLLEEAAELCLDKLGIE